VDNFPARHEQIQSINGDKCLDISARYSSRILSDTANDGLLGENEKIAGVVFDGSVQSAEHGHLGINLL